MYICVRIDGTGPTNAYGQPLDISLVTKWNGQLLTRNFSNGYTFRVVSKGCYYISDAGEWSSDGLTVGGDHVCVHAIDVQPAVELSISYIRCNCSHQTDFAAGLFVPPNTVNFDYVLQNARCV
jgi:hypothetical protein